MTHPYDNPQDTASTQTAKSLQCATTWAELLAQAVTQPGLILAAYSRFWTYSLGNQLLAMLQCVQRGIEPGPLATFPRWKELGRHVKKGEKALVLCMPITHKRKKEAEEDDASADHPEAVYTRFLYRAHWFVLSQTEGQDYTQPAVPTWNEAQALTTLAVTKEPFAHLDGNTQGCSHGRQIAINPMAALPHKTLFHELAHILLGHTAENRLIDSESTPRSLREVEAESVAMLCCASLDLPGVEYSRGYIQHWIAGETIPEKSAQKIFHAADQILKAGQ